MQEAHAKDNLHTETKYNIHFSYEFSPHLYGPYSEDLAHSLDTLITLGIVKEERSLIKICGNLSMN